MYLAFVCFGLAWFGLSPVAQALDPEPDGAYPLFNTAEGDLALNSLTEGVANTAVGWGSLASIITGNFNTGVGSGALVVNIADNNTAIGALALFDNISGHDNTATGFKTLLSNTTGGFNTATGETALYANTIGDDNTADGAAALGSNTSGVDDTATGSTALFNNTIGSYNTANGAGALYSNTIGDDNSADGFGALVNNTTGNENTGLGDQAGHNVTTGSDNVIVGFQSGSGVVTADNVICIGANVTAADVANSCYIGNIYGGDATGGLPVYVTSDGKLGAANPATASSARFKEEITPMDKRSEAILALEPVTFRYKKQIDPTSRAQFGLVAEAVEKVNPDLVVRDKEGKPYSVRYDAVNAMLLNEFLKEHRTVQELKKEVAALSVTVKEQAAQIQKVSAQLEMSKAAPQTVLNNQ
jgi:trimeric autotransporter adhesin